MLRELDADGARRQRPARRSRCRRPTPACRCASRARCGRPTREALLRLVFGWGELRIGTAASGARRRALAARARARDQRHVRRSTSPSAATGACRWPDASSGARRTGRQFYERVELRGPVRAGTTERRGGRRRRAPGSSSTARPPTSQRPTRRSCRSAARSATPRRSRPASRGAGCFPRPLARHAWTGRCSRAASAAAEHRLRGRRLGARGVDRAARHRQRGARVATRCCCARTEAELRCGGRTEIGWYGQRDALAGRARLEGWPVEDLVAFMGWDVARDRARQRRGRAVRGRRSAPEGEARLTARAGRYYARALRERARRHALERARRPR